MTESLVDLLAVWLGKFSEWLKEYFYSSHSVQPPSQVIVMPMIQQAAGYNNTVAIPIINADGNYLCIFAWVYVFFSVNELFSDLNRSTLTNNRTCVYLTDAFIHVASDRQTDRQTTNKICNYFWEIVVCAKYRFILAINLRTQRKL